MPAWLAALVLAAALATTYFLCLRPLRRGECGACDPDSPGRQQEVAAPREELRTLRAEEGDPRAR
jgi:hypothetical protein